MKALITGGTGFIGSYLVKELLDAGHEVRVIDVHKNSDWQYPVDTHILDIMDTKSLAPVFQGMDVIIHMAAKHRFFGVTEADFFRTNEDGTKSVLAAMEETGIKKLIFYSTVAVYGDSDVPTHEEMEARPGNPYGRSKLAAESWVRKWTEADPERSSIIIRPTVVFGPHNRGNIYRLIRQIYRRAYLPVGRGDNVKSIACVENLVAANLFLMGKRINGCEIFNYTDAPHLPYREIVALIYKGLGRKPPTYYLPVNPMVQVASIADKIIAKAGIAFSLKTALLKISKTTHHLSDKIRSLGFVPKYSSIEGLQRMTKWYLDDLKKSK